MKIDPNMYNRQGYLFEGKYSAKVSYRFYLIQKLIFIGNPPYNVELAYRIRKFVLWFYSKHNLTK